MSIAMTPSTTCPVDAFHICAASCGVRVEAGRRREVPPLAIRFEPTPPVREVTHERHPAIGKVEVGDRPHRPEVQGPVGRRQDTDAQERARTHAHLGVVRREQEVVARALQQLGDRGAALADVRRRCAQRSELVHEAVARVCERPDEPVRRAEVDLREIGVGVAAEAADVPDERHPFGRVGGRGREQVARLREPSVGDRGDIRRGRSQCVDRTDLPPDDGEDAQRRERRRSRAVIGRAEVSNSPAAARRGRGRGSRTRRSSTPATTPGR